MVSMVETMVLLIAWIVVPLFVSIELWRWSRGKRLHVMWVIVALAYVSFFSHESIETDENVPHTLTVAEAQGMTGEEIARTIMIHQLEFYKKKPVFTGYKIFAYTIDGTVKEQPYPVVTLAPGDKAYVIRFSVMTINSEWLGGSSDKSGLWLHKLGGIYRLHFDGEKYILTYVTD